MSMELAFAKTRIKELEQHIQHNRSAILTLLINVQVMLESGDYDEALEFIKEHTQKE